MIVCRDYLDPISYPDFPSNFIGCDCTLVSIKPHNSGRILIVSIYRPPEIKFESHDWITLFHGLSLVGSFGFVVVAGDLNAQYSGWGSTRDNHAGTSLRDFLERSCFIMLNNGSGTRVSASARYVSCPDITLVKPGIWRFSWCVGDDPLGSDHLPIDINFVINNEPDSGTNCNPIRTRLSLNHLDRRCFAMLVANHMSSIPMDIEAVQQYEKWHNVVIECSLFAGGSVIYNNGTCKRFDSKHNRIIHHGFKQHRKQVNVKLW